MTNWLKYKHCLSVLLGLSLLNGCVYQPKRINPTILQSVSIGTCVQLAQAMLSEQIIYSYNPRKGIREPLFTYQPQAFVHAVQSCQQVKTAIRLEDIHIDEEFTNFEFTSYRTFVFYVKVSLFIHGKYHRSKYYETQTDTDMEGLFNKVPLNGPLAQGFENILLDAEKDIEKIINNGG